MDTSTPKMVMSIFDLYGIDVKTGAMIDAAIALIVGLVRKRPVNQSRLKKAVDILVKLYDKYPIVISFVGLALGILFLLESNNDRQEVRRFQDEVIAVFKSYPPNVWERRLAEIRVGVNALKTRQRTMGAVKLLAAISFGCLAYASTASVLARTTLAMGSGACGGAALMNGVNYYNLHELIKRLERDGYLN